MRPRWLRGWTLWGAVRPQPGDSSGASDGRPWWQRVAVFVGVRREW